MAVVVVGEGKDVIVVFGGETEGVFGEDVAVGDAGGAGGAGDGAEGCVVVVRGDAVLRGWRWARLDPTRTRCGRRCHWQRPIAGRRGSCRKQSGSAWRPDRLVSLDSPRGGRGAR